MIGFYSTKTAQVLFGDDLVRRLANALLAGGVAIVSLSSLLALAIADFDLGDAHPLVRYFVGTLLVVLAVSVIINAEVNIAKNHASPYSLLPLLITPTAFVIYGVDLISEAVLLEGFYVTLYAIGLLANCILCLYSLLLIRKNKRLISFFLAFQLSLAVAILLLIHHDRALTISLVIWLSLLKFSLSIIVGSRVMQADHALRKKSLKNGTNNQDFLSYQLQKIKISPKIKIYIWMPEREMDGNNMAIPWIGKYFFAYSFDRNSIMVGHVAVSAEEFYASLYPDKQSFLRKSTKANLLQEIGARYRMFHPGYWADFRHDLEKRGTNYAEIEINIYDPESLVSMWGAMKGFAGYSLYSRNCSVVSIQLYEACINKSLSALPFVPTLFKVYLSANFWSAVIAKQRSEMFVWTPGLAYDYINNLQQLIAKLD